LYILRVIYATLLKTNKLSELCFDLALKRFHC